MEASPSNGECRREKRFHATQPSNPRKRRRLTRSSAGGVGAEQAVWDVRFKDVWAAVVKQGWKSKRPRGRSLDSRYKYLPPGGHHNGEEGRGFFLGEDAVLEHILVEQSLVLGSPSTHPSVSRLNTPTSRASGSTQTSPRTPPVMLQDMYVDKLVAFTPDKETWMKAKAYQPVGTSYIVGCVYRYVRKGKSASLFQVRWLDSRFQNTVETVSLGIIQRGAKNYVALTRVQNPNWRVLVEPDPTDVIDVGSENSDLEEDEIEAFDPGSVLPSSLAEVETIRKMRFVPSVEARTPSYLYEHADGRTYVLSISTYLNTRPAQASLPTYRCTSGAKYCIRPTNTPL
eukprot:jgi/Phyca11/96660/e_gw1.1.1415.1